MHLHSRELQARSTTVVAQWGVLADPVLIRPQPAQSDSFQIRTARVLRPRQPMPISHGSLFRKMIIGGYGLLLGRMVEMKTGEGKTITAVLPAVTAALVPGIHFL